MAQRTGGPRRKTHHKLHKHFSTKGKISLTRYFQVFKAGDNVILIIEPAVQKGIFHARFNGKRGKIVSKKGRAYVVQIKDGGKNKVLSILPIHLKKV